MRYLLMLSLFAILSCSKQNNPVPPASHLPKVSNNYSYEDIQAFKQLTVQGAFNPDGVIRKLPVHTSVYLADTIYPEMTAELEAIIAEINAQAGGQLQMYRTSDSSSPVITVHLTDSATFIAIEPETAYTFDHQSYQLHGLCPWWATSDDTIRHAAPFVDMVKATNPSFRKFLLRHEITHALGFLGHVSLNDFYSSVMYHYTITPYTTSYSSFDDSAIQLLYDPAVQVGMNESELDKVLN